ncbi:MAG: 7-cyano-7-deazaguanine synthase QueC [Phycisphaerales bacterium]|nr:7-cyano-7-deazaguanine synthase QueC [Phycisphaerales bacterium]MCI0630199.1 7-cyano-7-deazaguanine synthase QueC [Phycisphaerales bacterium]MCI0677203.1 7-cyano-7-deazaguanine synthase QueC [Phycisphaerales bacterium]
MPPTPTKSPAVVLLSGGLDSATLLAVAKSEAFECHALTFDYGQRHRDELEAAEAVARQIGTASHTVFSLNLRNFGGSALTDDIDVPKDRDPQAMSHGIPITYVPARNLIFLSIASGYAETLGARDLFIGVNAIDYSGYPDCRPQFIRSFEQTARLATKAGVEGRGMKIHAPLIELSKAQIIQLGTRLGVDYTLTHSCYDPTPEGLACGRCDSCQLRAAGFRDARIADPTRYAPAAAAAIRLR